MGTVDPVSGAIYIVWQDARFNGLVREGIALRPLDVDVALIYGYGFPRYRGGPMKYADMLGLPTVLAELERLSQEDAFFWRPSPLIVELVERGSDFSSLNGTAS